LFNASLGNCITALEGIQENMYDEDIYLGYRYDEFIEACEALRKDYISDMDFYNDFLFYNTDQFLLNTINKDYPEIDEENVSDVVEDYLIDICKTVDKEFLYDYLEEHFGE